MARKKVELKSLMKLMVGDGVTVSYGTDSYPFTVIEVSLNGKKAKIRKDKVIYIKDDNPCRDTFKYEQDENGQTYDIRLTTRRGIIGWYGEFVSRVTFGRHYYYDPHF